MNTQQLQQRNFRVNYRGGFALTNSTETVRWLVDNNTEVLGAVGKLKVNNGSRE